jgi:LmbE family N-acetylglucosaminyl deacetylase
MEQRSLLGVFAHPDDEAAGFSGSLLKYGEEGVKTAVVCATRGEAGQISDPALATPETLGAVREQELRTAMRIVGVGDVTFLDYRDGTLFQVDKDEAIGRIVRQMRRLRPQVIVTFDANGGYGHRDHIAVHRFTVAAFHRSGDPTCYPEQLTDGLEAYAPQKLYAMAFPRSVMRKMRRELEQQGQDLRPGGDQATIPLEEMGTPDDLITTVITLTEQQIEAKLGVSMAHRTQMSPQSPIEGQRPQAYLEWISTERFVLLYPPGAAPNSEDDLFAGVKV